MRSFPILVVAVALFGLGARTDAQAAPGFISPSLSTNTGALRCSVFNEHPTKTALVSLLFTDESCLKISGTLSIPPGFHQSYAVAAGNFLGPVNCRVQFFASSEVTKANLLPSFSVEDASGQTTAIVPITEYKPNLAPCP